MAPSATRKEEAELRQVAKKARLARKEAKTRAHKQRLRAARTAAAAATSLAGEASKAAGSEAQPRRKRQGAIILPEEIADLRRRLFDHKESAEGKAEDTTTTTTTAKKGKAGKAKRKAKGKATTSSAMTSASSEAAAATTAASEQAATLPAYEEPNYHMEIHFKRKMVLVDVILHHVPHQKIDLTGCTADQLVIDTTQHTKKYRLELPMPAGLRVNVEQSEFDLENGVLHCRLPIANEHIPPALQAEWGALVEKMRAQKALRFHMRQDGQLTVRVRQALLPQASKAAKTAEATAAPAESDAQEKEEEEEDDVHEERKDSNSTKKEKMTKKDTTQGKKRPREAAAKEEEGTTRAKASKTERPGTDHTTGKPDVFQQEHAKALSAAKEAAKKARLTLKQRVELAKQVQQQRQARLEIRTERKTQKDARTQSTFARVLEEQKRQLLERAALQAATEAAEKKRAAAKKSGAVTKTVHFAKD